MSTCVGHRPVIEQHVRLGAAQDGNNSWNDGDANAEFVSEVVPKFVKIGIIEEQLSEDEIGSGVDFFF